MTEIVYEQARFLFQPDLLVAGPRRWSLHSCERPHPGNGPVDLFEAIVKGKVVVFGLHFIPDIHLAKHTQLLLGIGCLKQGDPRRGPQPGTSPEVVISFVLLSHGIAGNHPDLVGGGAGCHLTTKSSPDPHLHYKDKQLRNKVAEIKENNKQELIGDLTLFLYFLTFDYII